MKKIDKERRVRDLETVIVWAVFLLLVHTFWPSRVWIPLCAVVLLTGLVLKATTSRMVRGWLGFSLILSRFNSRVILTLVFFLFLTPLALLYRLFAENPLLLKKETQLNSYFNTRNHPFTKKDFEKLW